MGATKGPFGKWVHTHLFHSQGSNRAVMEDQVAFKLPFGFFLIYPLTLFASVGLYILVEKVRMENFSLVPIQFFQRNVSVSENLPFWPLSGILLSPLPCSSAAIEERAF
jgi:hypothetical protein